MSLNLFRLSPFFFEANRDGGQAGGGGTNNQNQNSNQNQENGNQNDTQQADFTSWLAGQKEDIQKVVKPLFDAHVKGLRSSLEAAREERDDFSRQLRDAAKKLKADSDERKEFEGLADKLDEANRRADFFEEATDNNCHNARAAFAIAKAENLFTKSGAPDWKKIQEAVPEFFTEKKKVIKKRTAGEGAEGQHSGASSMNDWIRRSAGRGAVTQQE